MNASLTSETSELLFHCTFFVRGLNMSRASKMFKYRQYSVSATSNFEMGGDACEALKLDDVQISHNKKKSSRAGCSFATSIWSYESCYNHPSKAGDGSWYPLASAWCFPSCSRTTTNLRATLDSTWLDTVKKSRQQRMAIH